MKKHKSKLVLDDKTSNSNIEDRITKILKLKEESLKNDSDYKSFNNFINGLDNEGLLESPIYELPSIDTAGKLLFNYKRS